MNTIKTAVLLMLVLPFIAACSSMSEREKALYTVHVIDVAQTYQMSKSPCHMEIDPVTSRLIGGKPSQDSVLLWGVASAIAYHYAEEYLPDTIMNVNFILKAGVVNNNTDIGLTPSGYRCL